MLFELELAAAQRVVCFFQAFFLFSGKFVAFSGTLAQVWRIRASAALIGGCERVSYLIGEQGGNGAMIGQQKEGTTSSTSCCLVLRGRTQRHPASSRLSYLIWAKQGHRARPAVLFPTPPDSDIGPSHGLWRRWGGAMHTTNTASPSLHCTSIPQRLSIPTDASLPDGFSRATRSRDSSGIPFTSRSRMSERGKNTTHHIRFPAIVDAGTPTRGKTLPNPRPIKPAYRGGGENGGTHHHHPCPCLGPKARRKQGCVPASSAPAGRVLDCLPFALALASPPLHARPHRTAQRAAGTYPKFRSVGSRSGVWWTPWGDASAIEDMGGPPPSSSPPL